jgi:hypothetical protein
MFGWIKNQLDGMIFKIKIKFYFTGYEKPKDKEPEQRDPEKNILKNWE